MRVFALILVCSLAPPTWAGFSSNFYDVAYDYCVDNIHDPYLEDACIASISGQQKYVTEAVFNLCVRPDEWEDAFKCFESGAGKTDDGVVEICDVADDWVTTRKCLTAGANKFYTPKELKRCQGRQYWSSTNNCLKNSGSPHQDSAFYSVAFRALELIRSDKPEEAERLLEEFLKK